MWNSNQKIVPQNVISDSDYSGIVTVTTAGTPESFPSVENEGGFYVTAHPGNTGANIWVMHDGEAKTSAFPVKSGQILHIPVVDLDSLDCDAETNGDKVCWAKA